MRSQSFTAQDALYVAAADSHARLTVQRTGESALRPNDAAYIPLFFRSSAGKLDKLTARFQRNCRGSAWSIGVPERLRLRRFLPAHSPSTHGTLRDTQQATDCGRPQAHRPASESFAKKHHRVWREVTANRAFQRTPRRPFQLTFSSGNGHPGRGTSLNRASFRWRDWTMLPGAATRISVPRPGTSH